MFYDGKWCFVNQVRTTETGGGAPWIGLRGFGRSCVWTHDGNGVYKGLPGTSGRRVQAVEGVSGLAFTDNSAELAVICRRTGADGQPRCVLDVLNFVSF
jgi:hypothetical protein